MAKKQSSFWNIVLSGAIAFVLVGGGIASMRLVQQDSNNQSNAWGGTTIRFRAPYFAPGNGAVPFATAVPTVSRQTQPTPGTTTVCWNRVAVSGTQYYWPNGCKGMPGNYICTQVVTQLTADEVQKYSAWLQAGKPALSGCEVPNGGAPRALPTGNEDVKMTPTPQSNPPTTIRMQENTDSWQRGTAY